MQRQLDVVTKMMVHLLDQKAAGGSKEEAMEVVKPGVQQLPMLHEPGDTAPIDLGDWLTTVEPVMADLSDGSHWWWAQVVREATAWYKDYVKLRPIQRTNFEANPSDELKKEKWVRVERRAVTMMLAAIPSGVKEELVATKSLTPLRILAKLMSLYQPGGLQEKTVILKQLEDPGEATSAAQGVQQLRKWLRWLRRAEDVGLSLPDASILVRGLNKLMKKLLGTNQEMAFRASLIRNTLQLNSIPNHETVKTFSEHLLGEMEQMVHLEKKTKQRALSPPQVDRSRWRSRRFRLDYMPIDLKEQQDMELITEVVLADLAQEDKKGRSRCASSSCRRPGAARARSASSRTTRRTARGGASGVAALSTWREPVRTTRREERR